MITSPSLSLLQEDQSVQELDENLRIQRENFELTQEQRRISEVRIREEADRRALEEAQSALKVRVEEEARIHALKAATAIEEATNQAPINQPQNATVQPQQVVVASTPSISQLSQQQQQHVQSELTVASWSVLSRLPDVSKSRDEAVKAVRIEDETNCLSLSNDAQQSFNTLTNILQSLHGYVRDPTGNASSPSSAIYDSMGDSASNSTLNQAITLDTVMKILSSAVRNSVSTLRVCAREDKSLLLKYVVTLFSAILDKASTVSATDGPLHTQIELVLMYAAFITGVFRDFNPHLKSKFGALFRGMLFHRCHICQLSISSALSATNKRGLSVPSRNGIVMLAALCTDSSISSPFDTSFAWRWINCTQKELEAALYDCGQRSNKADSVSHEAFARVALFEGVGLCRALYYFLVGAGSYLFKSYGVKFAEWIDGFIPLLTTITALREELLNKQKSTLPIRLSDDWVHLRDLAIKMSRDRRTPSRCFQHKEPHVLAQTFIK